MVGLDGELAFGLDSGLDLDSLASNSRTGLEGFKTTIGYFDSAPRDVPYLALQLHFIGGSESMGDHDSGSDDWWCVG
jgi:hypothetical protein